MEALVAVGYFSVVSMVMLVVTCLHSCHRKKKTAEELQKERFKKFYKKYMLPRDRYLASRVDFVRKPVDNLDTTQSSVTGRSDNTYEDISTPRSSKPDLSLTIPPRTPFPSPDKCIIDELASLGPETASSSSSVEGLEDMTITSGNWLRTPGQLASYISFRQTSQAILVVPSAVNIMSSDSREYSDSDNNSMDYGSEVCIEIPVHKELNTENSEIEETRKDYNMGGFLHKASFNKQEAQNETDFNLSRNYEKFSKKKISDTERSWKSDPTYESIKSLYIPKIKVHRAKKSRSDSSEPTYESLNSELCFDLGRSDGLEHFKDDKSDTSSFRRSFESVKSGRDFTVFEINCEDDPNDVFLENMSVTQYEPSIDSSRHSYPGQIKFTHQKPLSESKSDEEQRYSPFPVREQFSVRPKICPHSASPRFSMIQTISGNLKPKLCTDLEEQSVLNTPQSVPKIRISSSDCVFLNSITNSERDNTIPDLLENTPSISDTFDSETDTIKPLKTYQTLRTIYSNARRSSWARKNLMSLPSVTEQTESEIDQHLANNLHVKSTPLPTIEMTNVFHL